jgi:hypothetical protein
MSSSVRKFIHTSAETGLSVALTSAYVAGAQRQQLELWSDSPPVQAYSSAAARLSALFIQVSTIAAGASSITCRITRDAAGDQTIVGDTTATISPGITTATVGAITIRMNIDYKYTSNDLWVHMRTNAGTCTVTQVELFWEE